MYLNNKKSHVSTFLRHPLSLALVAAISSSALIQAPAQAAPGNLPVVQTLAPSMPSSFANVAEQARPAVVNISTKRSTNGFGAPDFRSRQFGGANPPFQEFFRHFFERQSHNTPGSLGLQQQALGSGFIIDADGYIVTNQHVIDGADEITITLDNGDQYEAKLLGADDKTDLALLKIDAPKALPHVNFGSSDSARVGDWVIAVGNPFGLGGTFTAGIISARGRDIDTGPYDDYLQIDASINRGNSGGPLFNTRGEVIGINTAIYSPNGGNVGIGFAVPTSLAEPIIEQLRDSGAVQRAWLGVQIQKITGDLADALGLDGMQGALVVDVTEDSPASQAKLAVGDVILAVNDKPVKQFKDLPRIIANARTDQAQQLKIWRNGKEQRISVQLRSQNQPENNVLSLKTATDRSVEGLGLRLEALSPQARMRYGLEDMDKGVVVVDVARNSPAARKGLRPGDVILQVGQQSISNPQELQQALNNASAASENILMLLSRQGHQQFITLNANG